MGRIVTAAGARLRHSWTQVWEPWSTFWFQPADPTPLCLMRILFGCMLLYTHAVWGLNLDGFFGPHGWQGDALVHLVQRDQFAWSFWWYIPDGYRLAVHVAALAILVFYTLGLLTPVTSILAYLITVSYAYRAPVANFGLDQINAMAALYLAIGPSGSTLSLDRLWARYRAARREGKQQALSVLPSVLPSARANFALRLMQVHVCVIYIFACLSKLQGDSWWNGLAIWQAVSNLEYQSRDLTWLAWYPWLVNLLTHATILFEMTFWALVWKPLCRPVVLLVGVAIHLGIGAFMGMWTFGLALIFTYVAFVPAPTWCAILNGAGGALRVVVRKARLVPVRVGGRRLQAACRAIGLETAAPIAPPIAAEAPAPLEAIEVGRTIEADEPIELREPAELHVPADLGATAESGEIAESGATIKLVVPSRGRRAPVSPTLVLVEGRVKRQTQIQEYFLRHGLRCLVAAELHEARSLLSVAPIDALVITSTWLPADEVVDFRDSLISGGAMFPASVMLFGSANRETALQLEPQARHHIIVGNLSLRELRHSVLEVLGLAREKPRIQSRRSRHAENGRDPSRGKNEPVSNGRNGGGATVSSKAPQPNGPPPKATEPNGARPKEGSNPQLPTIEAESHAEH